MKRTVLVVDDKPNFVALLTKVLGTELHVVGARGVKSAVRALAEHTPDAVVCDLRMPDGDGLEVLRALRATGSGAPFILMTAYATVSTAVQAMREGAYDYVTKPFDPDVLRALVLRALEEREHIYTPIASVAPVVAPLVAPPVTTARAGFGALVGASAAMNELYRLLERAAPTEATVLILGETGVGKELVARAVHEHSARRARPMVSLNCAAIPRALLESELFGYARGSFTGATADRAGLFEQAEKSTLFLDELGELKPAPQAKLTRVLEERAVRRLGEARERKVDVRIIAATHRDLPALVKQGEFREDLWFRLHVCVLHVPPLRERGDDVSLLAERFLQTYAPGKTLAPEALAALRAYPWPGNVRELRSAIERATIVEEGSELRLASLPDEVRGAGPARHGRGVRALGELTYREVVDGARDEAVQRYVVAVLQRFRGNVTAAAQHAGLERESLHRLLRRFELSAEAFRAGPEEPGAKRRDDAPEEGDDE